MTRAMDLRNEDLVADWCDGATRADLAERYGMASTAVVSRTLWDLRRRGWTIPRRLSGAGETGWLDPVVAHAPHGWTYTYRPGGTS